MLALCLLRGPCWIQASDAVRYVSAFLVSVVAVVQYYLQHIIVMKGDPWFPVLLDETIIIARGLFTYLKTKNDTNDSKRFSLPMLKLTTNKWASITKELLFLPSIPQHPIFFTLYPQQSMTIMRETLMVIYYFRACNDQSNPTSLLSPRSLRSLEMSYIRRLHPQYERQS